MEGTPTYLDYTEVLDTFLRIDGVLRVHNLRIWALSINKVALSAHLAIGNLFFLSKKDFLFTTIFFFYSC